MKHGRSLGTVSGQEEKGKFPGMQVDTGWGGRLRGGSSRKRPWQVTSHPRLPGAEGFPGTWDLQYRDQETGPRWSP